MTTYLDVHVLQTVPPSCINRDDTGSPKTALYGGVRRARVSSQAWKRATRQHFSGALDTSMLGVRTRRVVELLAEEVQHQDSRVSVEDALALAEAVFTTADIKVERPKTKKGEEQEPARSGALMFLSRSQVERLAATALHARGEGRVLDKKTDGKALKALFREEHSVDVALFGRMVAEAPDLRVDAAAQVAHALSVHAVSNDFDYFTAVDDRAPEDNAGAAMIGTVEFNSSTLYRYATVNITQLKENLGDADEGLALRRAALSFLDGFVRSMPTGRQNTFAHRTLPDAVLVQLRHDQPVNLAGAFEDAVETSDGHGRLRESCERLVEHADALAAAYQNAPAESLVVHVGKATEPLASLGEVVSLPELLDRVEAALEQESGAR